MYQTRMVKMQGRLSTMRDVGFDEERCLQETVLKIQKRCDECVCLQGMIRSKNVYEEIWKRDGDKTILMFEHDARKAR